MTQTPLAYWLQVKGFALHLPYDAMPFGTAEQWGYEHLPYVVIAEYKNYPVHLLLTVDEQLSYQPLRSLLHRSEQEFQLFNRAVGLQHFFQNQRFCGHCGTPTSIDAQMLAVHCPQCQYLNFPRISPSIIVGIRRGTEILLAHHARHKEAIYTVLAGFVEMGETLEMATHREVQEESGLTIQNLQYVGSQPWSFPNSLMVGFLAEYAGGEICVQKHEIRDARWFDVKNIQQVDDLPVKIPAQGTIARQLIELQIAQIQQEIA
ncbi:MAG: NAD(+) diphosphatase [Acinetobacter sp.]|nr:NAD(+) diphosphatase [Acinetobacter sp.]